MNVKIILLAVFSFGCLVGIPPVVYAQHKAQSSKSSVQEIFRLINQHRASKGLKPLKLNEAIIKEAEKHSRNMASGAVPFGHDGFNGRSDRLMNGIKNANSAGENVAYSQGAPAHVVDNWLNSPVHKKNIEGDYTLTGIGIATAANGQVYYTQIFIRN